MSINFESKNLKVNEKILPFSLPIEKIIERPDGVIVLLEANTSVPQNIFWVDLNGVIRWQIDHMGPKNAAFVDIKINKDGVLEANNFTGYICKVNHENGKLYECRYELT